VRRFFVSFLCAYNVKESGASGCSVKIVVNLQQYRHPSRKSAFSFCQYRHKNENRIASDSATIGFDG
jgi:hypothetical protein